MLIGVSAAQAHVASNSFLDLDVHGHTVTGSIEVAVRDAELAVGLDANRDGRVTWGELRAGAPKLAMYLAQHISVSSGTEACLLRFGDIRVNRRVDGNYAYLPLAATCSAEVRELQIRYQVLSGLDPSHRGLLRLRAGEVAQTAVLGGDDAPLKLVVDHPAPWRTFREYLTAGVWHIWSGIDHLLFLLSLLLPAVLMRRGGKWEPVKAAQPAFVSILKVVTAFTIAHSITLSLAAFNVVHLPSRVTESAIAASIVVAALNNIFPVVTESRARIAFGFGLLHGFGFASVLAEMGLPNGARLISLLSFNLGIEFGQLAIVLAIMPIAYAVRSAAFYRQGVLPWGSALITLLATVWFVQRAFFPT